MGDNQFVGEIRIFPYNWAPYGWFPCDGRQLPIQSYGMLYTIIGTYYGGDGRSYFNLPDLRGEVAQGLDPRVGSMLNDKVGSNAASINYNQLPYHTHTLVGTKDAATTVVPGNSMYPAAPQKPPSAAVNPFVYAKGTAGSFPSPQVAMAADALGITGNGSNPSHNNMQPTLVLNPCICWDGYYPNFQ